MIKADTTKAVAAGVELYSGICIFLTVAGMLVLMFAPGKKLLNISCGVINVIAGLPIVMLINTWGLEQEFTTPLLCLLIGVILLARAFGKRNKQSHINPLKK